MQDTCSLSDKLRRTLTCSLSDKLCRTLTCSLCRYFVMMLTEWKQKAHALLWQKLDKRRGKNDTAIKLLTSTLSKCLVLIAAYWTNGRNMCVDMYDNNFTRGKMVICRVSLNCEQMPCNDANWTNRMYACLVMTITAQEGKWWLAGLVWSLSKCLVVMVLLTNEREDFNRWWRAL